jgi:hypothetical protein
MYSHFPCGVIATPSVVIVCCIVESSIAWLIPIKAVVKKSTVMINKLDDFDKYFFKRLHSPYHYHNTYAL